MDSLKDWTSVLEWLKRPFFAFVAAIVLGAMLLSTEILDWLGLGSFRWIVAILFVLASCIFLSQVLAVIWKTIATVGAAIGSWLERRTVAKNHRKRLHQLTDDEKLILKGYVDRKTRAQNLDRFDGVVICLEDAGVIYRGSNSTLVYGPTIRFPYVITDFAWDYLNKHPDMLTADRHG
ncbi:super-infection exclusion protein B [Anatilimnocola floriformis]|uniref:super-infection exclusion protein B n=1 Tax=Anatilimnocola floriformis TaxID=2948575 RepID=UPI0020C4629D|nr:super-infection exclusion protein B [Anatilimnocola floriformis]